MYVIIQEAVFIELRFSNEVERTLRKMGLLHVGSITRISFACYC